MGVEKWGLYPLFAGCQDLVLPSSERQGPNVSGNQRGLRERQEAGAAGLGTLGNVQAVKVTASPSSLTRELPLNFTSAFSRSFYLGSRGSRGGKR